MRKVAIIGLGSVGLPTALLAAQSGLKVIGIDVDKEQVEKINECSLLCQEPNFSELLQETCGKHNFYATVEYSPADYFIIAVPILCTETKKANTVNLSSVICKVAGVLKKGDTVIITSTVPVGTTRSLTEVLAKESGLEPGKDFFVAHCPERTDLGNTLQELKVNDRTIGGIDYVSAQQGAEFYKFFVSGDLYLTDCTTAETVKLIENSYRDVNTAFSRQVTEIAQQEGLNPYEVIELVNKNPHTSIMYPLSGIGGCYTATDPWFLIQSFKEDTDLLKIAREVNDLYPQKVFARIKKEVTMWGKKYSKPCKIIVLGLTYKPDVDDLRESPAYAIVQKLAKDEGLNFTVYEPHVEYKKVTQKVQEKMVTTYDGLKEADMVISLVAHSVFKKINKDLLKKKKVLDFCGLFYEPRRTSIEQEQFFWPASGMQKKNLAALGDDMHKEPLLAEEQA